VSDRQPDYSRKQSGTIFKVLRAHANTNRGFRRGVYLLPSVLTIANLFCGYVCVVYTIQGEYFTAAPFIGIAIVLDVLDGRIARMTGSSSEFGAEFDSLADIVSFGIAPSVLVLSWGLEVFGRVGWAAAFLFVAAAALRLARFNVQSVVVDKRRFIGLPTPAAAGVSAATVFVYPYKLSGPLDTWLALAMVVALAFLMISTIRYVSFKTMAFGGKGSYRNLIFITLLMVAVVIHPQGVLVLIAYTYLISGVIGLLTSRLKRRQGTVDRSLKSTSEGSFNEDESQAS
jgi:CDP-diacylglycerol--serine O-phosphatidyltransferase